MTRDDIVAMAREAGIYHAFDSEGHWDGLTDEQLIERHPPHPNDIVYGEKRTVEILERFSALVAAVEREACAKVCDKEIEEWGWDADVVDVGMSIRARGETK